MTVISEKFYIIGHRGAAGEYFENSLEGFEHVLQLDIDGIELDIRESAEELWVFHDNDLQRLTGNTGLFDEHENPASLRLGNGEAIPTLKQVLDLYWNRMPVNIEIKTIRNLQRLLDLLALYPEPEPRGQVPAVLISSFNHQALGKLRQLGCRWPLAPISSGIPYQFEAELTELDPWSWHFDNEYLDFEMLDELRNRGIPSFVFTVNETARALELKQHGAAGIFTDFPSKMIQID